MGVERAADPGVEGRDAERQRPVLRQVDAHHLGRQVVVADRDQRPAVARAHQVGAEDVHDDDIGQHEL